MNTHFDAEESRRQESIDLTREAESEWEASGLPAPVLTPVRIAFEVQSRWAAPVFDEDGVDPDKTTFLCGACGLWRKLTAMHRISDSEKVNTGMCECCYITQPAAVVLSGRDLAADIAAEAQAIRDRHGAVNPDSWMASDYRPDFE